MGHGTESSMEITLVPEGGHPQPEIMGSWRFGIYHGPTRTVHEPFTDIVVSVKDADGSVTRLNLDPDAPTIDSINKLIDSGSPLLQAMFQGFSRLMID